MGNEKPDGQPAIRSISPWLVGIGSSIAATAFLPVLQKLGGYLLALPGYIGQTFRDRAYSHAVIVNDWGVSLLLVEVPLVLLIFTMWLVSIVGLQRPVAAQVFRLVPACVSMAMVLLLMGLMFMAERSFDAHQTYERRMMVLTVEFTEEERKQLISQWGRVQSEENFNQLMTRMEELAKKYDIILPQRRDR